MIYFPAVCQKTLQYFATKRAVWRFYKHARGLRLTWGKRRTVHFFSKVPEDHGRFELKGRRLGLAVCGMNDEDMDVKID